MNAPADPPSTWLARWVKDPYPGISHGVGAILAAVGLLVLLLTVRDDTRAVVSVCIYGVALIALYTASCLAHSIRGSPRLCSWLDRFDYAAIFFLIAGTYTPICLNTLHGPWGWTLLSIEWGMALVGATMVLVVGPRKIWVLMYLPMGWLAAAAVVPLLRGMEVAGLALLAIGGLIYSVGAVVFVTKRPRLWPGRFDYHDLWHTMVLIASGCHFATIAMVTT